MSIKYNTTTPYFYTKILLVLYPTNIYSNSTSDGENIQCLNIYDFLVNTGQLF